MRKHCVLAAILGLAATAASPAAAQPKDIVETAIAAGSFKTLAKLLTDADLVEVMKRGPQIERKGSLVSNRKLLILLQANIVIPAELEPTPAELGVVD